MGRSTDRSSLLAPGCRLTRIEHMSESLTSSEVRASLRVLGSLDTEDATDAERIDLIRALEELKGAAAAAQARVTVAFDASQRRAQRDAAVPERRVGAGVAAQVALALRESPHRGARHVGLAHALVHELPQTMTALAASETSEWRATLVARETACLSGDDRRAVDAGLAARRGGIGSLGDAELVAEARRLGHRLDPHAVTDRAARAHADAQGDAATRAGHHGGAVCPSPRGPGRRGLTPR